MKLANLLNEFPNARLIGTGGGCTALRIPIGDKRYALVTDGDASAPTDETIGDDSEPSMIVRLYFDDDIMVGVNFLDVRDTIVFLTDWSKDR